MSSGEKLAISCIDCGLPLTHESYTVMSGGGYGDPPDIVCDVCLPKRIGLGFPGPLG